MTNIVVLLKLNTSMKLLIRKYKQNIGQLYTPWGILTLLGIFTIFIATIFLNNRTKPLTTHNYAAYSPNFSPNAVAASTSPNLCPTATPSNTNTQTKIMPLGDSITAWAYSYRVKLKTSLNNAGWNSNFVGNNITTGDYLANSDPEHDGWPGYTISGLSVKFDSILTWIATDPLGKKPHTILLHIGTNDIFRNRSNPALYNVNTAVTDLNALVDKITTNLPDAKVYVASIIPMGTDFDPNGTNVNAYNNAIRPVIEGKGGNVYFVDMYTEANINPDVDLEGGSTAGLHPTQTGADKMGDVWYKHLNSTLSGPVCVTPMPTQTPVPTPVPATSTPTPIPTSTPTPPLPTPLPSTNLISNPGFESGKLPWFFYTNGTGSFIVGSPAYSGTKSAKISLNTIGNNMQLYQTGISLKPNTRYKLSFAAYSSTGHNMKINLLKHTSPYTNYGLSYTPNLTTSWQTFSTEFTSSGFTNNVNDARLRFYFVGFASAGDLYYLDNIKLEKISPL